MEENRAESLLRSAEASKAAYERRIQRVDLDHAIRDYEALLQELTENHLDFPLHANALCELYHHLAQHTGDVVHDGHALNLALKALHKTAADSVQRLDCLYFVGLSHAILLYIDRDRETATIGLRYLDEALRLAGDEHPKLALILSARARIFRNLALCAVGDERMATAEQSIRIHRASLAHATTDADRAHVLYGYSTTLIQLHSRLPLDWNALEDAISMMEESISLVEPPDHRTPQRLNVLAIAHYKRWSSNPSAYPGDIRRTQQYLHSATELLPRDHVMWRTFHLNDAAAHLDIFETYGSLDDLEAGFTTLKASIESLPRDYPEFWGRADDLGRALLMAFRNRGLSTLLDESIHWYEVAVQHVPQFEMASCLRRLGAVSMERYRHQGDTLALKSAIEAFEKAKKVAHHPHESLRVFVDLGSALTTRYLAQGRIDDLNKGIEYLEQYIASPTLDDMRDLPIAHDAYGQAMLARFHETGRIETLYDAKASFKTALDLASTAQSSLAEYHQHLGGVERLLFLATRSSHHLEKAIEAFRMSTTAIRDSHPLTAAYRYELAVSLIARFETTLSASDIEEASALLVSAYTHEQSFVKHRWLAAKERARLLHQDDPEAALDSYEVAISLLPLVAWLGLEEQVRYETAQNWLSLGNNAAACALSQGKPELAVELLESSRSILWNQQLQLGQVNHDIAQAIHPDLLAELKSVGRALEATFMDNVFESPSSADSEEGKRMEQASRARRHLADRWNELVTQVRALPGASNFLRRTKYPELQGSAGSGPVVALNVSEYRSDGIIILADGPPRVFPLQNARPEVISLHAVHLITSLYQTKDWYGLAFAEGQVSQLLQTLWTAVGEDLCLPLLPFLPQGRLSRVWLMPTGALAALPLHAAVSGGTEPIGLLDVMIPSYAPTLSALIRARERVERDEPAGSKMLAIGCSKLADESSLPSWLDEKGILVEHFRAEDLTILENDEATSEQVLQHLKNHNFVHITSHGYHDWRNPYRSHIALHDGPLTLRKLAQQKLDHADFAFLSACHTARIDPRAPDESVNLVSGLNLAGFRSIIGTIWGIADCDAADAAEAVYSHLMRDGRKPDPSEAAEALHEAVQRMRRRGLPVIRWAPFIHIGL